MQIAPRKTTLKIWSKPGQPTNYSLPHTCRARFTRVKQAETQAQATRGSHGEICEASASARQRRLFHSLCLLLRLLYTYRLSECHKNVRPRRKKSSLSDEDTNPIHLTSRCPTLLRSEYARFLDNAVVKEVSATAVKDRRNQRRTYTTRFFQHLHKRRKVEIDLERNSIKPFPKIIRQRVCEVCEYSCSKLYPVALRELSWATR